MDCYREDDQPERGLKHHYTVVPGSGFVTHIFVRRTHSAPVFDDVRVQKLPIVAWRIPLAAMNGDAIGSAGEPEPVFVGCTEVENPVEHFWFDEFYVELGGGALRILAYHCVINDGIESAKAWALERARKKFQQQRGE